MNVPDHHPKTDQISNHWRQTLNQLGHMLTEKYLLFITF